jgi:16S rRNA A1518/A1519 N6-dimethyltransferase RsmA/KsgA/DIM1 with predicted DNA glycosylase/AP lyase activity
MAENNHKSIKLDKRKGQHILTDRRIILRQIKYANLKGTETVLEIGSGPGTLTLRLAESAKKVIAIEKDKRFITYLKDKIPENVELIHADAMKMEFPEFDAVDLQKEWLPNPIIRDIHGFLLVFTIKQNAGFLNMFPKPLSIPRPR